MQQEISLFFGVILFGLLHGINPSHGWIVAVLYSIRKKRQIISSSKQNYNLFSISIANPKPIELLIKLILYSNPVKVGPIVFYFRFKAI
jgi:hypothetical protein